MNTKFRHHPNDSCGFVALPCLIWGILRAGCSALGGFIVNKVTVGA